MLKRGIPRENLPDLKKCIKKFTSKVADFKGSIYTHENV